MQILADGDHPIDMANIGMADWLTGDKFKITQSKYTLYQDDITITFSGNSLEVDRKGVLVDGVVSNIVINYGRTYEDFTLRMMRVDAEDLSRVIRSKSQADDKALFNSLLKGDDKVFGSEYADNLFGGKGNEFIRADRGNDTVNGGDGDDRLVGGLGGDLLSGGNGADVFQFDGWPDSEAQNGIDTILDFSQEQGDRISIDGAGIISFDDLNFTIANGETKIDILNGFTTMTIKFTGEITFTASDFVL